MKKLQLTLLALLSIASTQAQTILSEDFETGNTGSSPRPVAVGEGWTTIDSYKGSKTNYTWHNYYSDPESQSGPTISGACCASCDAPISTNPTDGSGPREEILLSPELNLDNTYQLQFTWKVSPMNAMDYSRYDFQVRVVTDGNLQSAETIFSIQNEQMLRESGVGVFPINTWDPHTSKVDLSDWQGEKVQLAFVYKMFTESANVLWLDDICVSQFTPAKGPIATVSMDRYDFKDIYLGEKKYSEVITLTNTGKDGLTVTGTEFPQGIGVNADLGQINLKTYQSVNFQLTYTASMTSPASGNAIIHTTGGDVNIAFSAQKQLLPEGCQLETFEKYFPPAGWRNNGWSWTTTAIEGDHSAYTGGSFTATTLRSPRLDLSEGGQLTFTYYNLYNGDYAPEYDIELQVSYDGGDNWTTKWISDYQNGLNQLLTETVDLGIGSDESYVRWYYPAVESDDEGAFDFSYFTLDRVVLPHVYGADGVPLNATVIAPANGATEIYPKDVVLQWAPAQFATGYRIYVGTNVEANDLVDGVDVGEALTYTIPVCDYETTYRWKVVGYNQMGASMTASTWRFTTQKDASVLEFPYEENFDECATTKDVPTGWLSTTTAEWENRRWEPLATSKAYGGKGASMYTMWLSAGKSSTITSPEFRLPADGEGMSISFVWGDNHPVDLIIDESGLLKKENVEGGNGYSDVTFEIFSDGAWKQAAYLSENYNSDGDTKYWRNETVDLSDYAGKTVQFRWTNNSYGGQHRGAGLDNIVINGNVGARIAFNKNGWSAGKVNYKKGVNSGNQFSLINTGKDAQKVKSVTFATDNFESSIAAGDVIAAGEGISFNLTFWAKDAAKVVTDEMTIEFESGLTATFPVEGEGLQSDTYYYAFEPNPLDMLWENDFTMIDADNAASYSFSAYWIHYSKDGQKSAFSAEDDDMETGMYGIMSPVSGTHALLAASPTESTGRSADNWIVWKKMTAGNNAKFDFYARNWESAESVLPSPPHRVSVLVSKTGNTKTSDFTAVMSETEMPYLSGHAWNHYEVDLSAYAGEEIYVAVRHTTVGSSNVAFFDDFTFADFNDGTQSIDAARIDVGSNALVEVYGLNGLKLTEGRGNATLQTLDHGLYVIKVTDGNSAKTLRIVK